MMMMIIIIQLGPVYLIYDVEDRDHYQHHHHNRNHHHGLIIKLGPVYLEKYR